MPTKLKDLKITSTDLVNAGANPDAHIRLFKRKDDSEADTNVNLMQKISAAIAGVLGKTHLPESINVIEKEATTFDEEFSRERLRGITNEAWNMAYALSDSWSSIICDNDLSEEDKRDMMFQSLDEFAEAARNAIPKWAAGEPAEMKGAIIKSKAHKAAFDAYWAEHTEPQATTTESAMTKNEPNDQSNTNDNVVEKSYNPNQKEEADTMKIDKSKMTPEEQSILAELEKKYGTAEPEGISSAADNAGGTPAGDVAKDAEPPATTTEGTEAAIQELHPEVKKALAANATLAAQVEELRKSLEIKDLTTIAKKYEIVGKKPEELAPKLYDLKKAGGTAYDDYVALLDEQLALVEKGGLFSEFGRNTSGGIGTGDELNVKAAEIKKASAGMSDSEAFAKAYEAYPDLAAKYEQSYRGRA